MVEEEEVRSPYRPTSFDEDKNRTALDKAFPEELERRRMLQPTTSRWLGKMPDYYDGLGYRGGWVALWNIVESKAQAQIKHQEPNGQAKSHLKEALDDAVFNDIELHTVSLGGGKGRKEAVELGQIAMPGERPSRWSWRQKG